MGYKIREIRKAKRMSQEELAQKSGVSRGTISALENGSERNTTSKTLIKIAHALDTTVDKILFADRFYSAKQCKDGGDFVAEPTDRSRRFQYVDQQEAGELYKKIKAAIGSDGYAVGDVENVLDWLVWEVRNKANEFLKIKGFDPASSRKMVNAEDVRGIMSLPETYVEYLHEPGEKPGSDGSMERGTRYVKLDG